MGRTQLALAFALAASLWSCRRLPELIRDTCGNGVVEAGEDCDLFSQFGGNSKCGDECRYLCDFEGDMETPLFCPQGRSCGRDNLCRIASGTYAPALNSPFALETTELSIADLDGDRIEDLAGGTPDLIDVRYGVGDGTYRERFSIAIDTPRGGRSLGDINGDRIDDLLVPYLLGVSPFLGDRSRTLIPYAHPQLELGSFLMDAGARDTRFVVGRVTPNVGSTTAFVVWTDGRTLDITFDPEGGDTISVPVTGERLTAVEVADLTEGPDTDELLIAIEGEPRVWLGRIRCESHCEGNDGSFPVGTVLLQPVSLEGFGKLSGERIHLADFDGDGRLDLLLLAENDSGRSPVLLHGTGTGFAPPREEQRLSECFVAGDDCWPLAAAAQDELPVFVLSQQVLTSTVPGGALTVAHLNYPSPWTRAVTGDFDGDGEIDIAAIDAIASSVVLLFRAGDTFNRIDIPLPGVPQELAAGDYDGDGVGDLACVLQRDGDEIHVVFGETSGPPDDAIFMGRFPRIAHLQPTFFVSPAPWNADLITDLIVEVSQARDRLPDSASILIGTGRRRMQAPIPLTGTDDEFGTPYLVRTGRLDGSSDGLDLMALTLQGELWVLANQGGGRFSMNGMVHLPVDGPQLGPCGLDAADMMRSCATLEVGSIDPIDSAIEEAVLADRSSSCPPRSDPVHLGIVSFANGTWSCRPIDPAQVFGDRTDLRKMKLADVDGDTQLDLILAAGGDEPAVFVAFGATTEPFQTVVEIGLNQAQPIDLTAVEGAQLAILTDQGLAVAKFGQEDGRTLVSLDMVAANTGSRVLASKVDPDGLEDLLVGDRDRVYVFEAQESFSGGTRVPQ